MKRPLTGGLLLLVTLVTSACDRTSPPQVLTPEPGPSNRMTGTVSMNAPGLPVVSSDVLIGRTLTLEVGNRGWNENLGSTAYFNSGVKPVASTVIDAELTYVMTLPAQVKASSLDPVTGFWTTAPFTSGTCSVQTQQYSNSAMNLGMGTLRVLPGGAATRSGYVGWPLDFRSTAPVLDLVTQALVYADRAGTVNVQYDCVSEFNFRMKSNTQLSLQAGWNVLVKHSVESGGPGAVYAYETRSRPLLATGEGLVYLQDSLYLDGS